MKVVVGLGNPGKKYGITRHNTGWLFLDWLITDSGFVHLNWQTNFHSEILEGGGDSKTSFIKPQTFMNESGAAVKAVCDFYKLNIKNDLIIIHDDSDLALGTIRATASASSAGHNGVQDIIDRLGTKDFHRVRIGIESRELKSELTTEAFVLQNFTADELKKLKEDVFPIVKLNIEKFIGNCRKDRPLAEKLEIGNSKTAT